MKYETKEQTTYAQSLLDYITSYKKEINFRKNGDSSIIKEHQKAINNIGKDYYIETIESSFNKDVDNLKKMSDLEHIVFCCNEFDVRHHNMIFAIICNNFLDINYTEICKFLKKKSTYYYQLRQSFNVNYLRDEDFRNKYNNFIKKYEA